MPYGNTASLLAWGQYWIFLNEMNYYFLILLLYYYTVGI
jgi:hypothetical protein